MRRRFRNERGAALLEAAITIPLILLISVAIFEFGRAFQTWQVLTNAAREGARIAVMAARPTSRSARASAITSTGGGLPLAESTERRRARRARRPVRLRATRRASHLLSVQLHGPEPGRPARDSGSATGAGPLSMGATALMRNEN
jgi:hypothetical protein